MYNDSAYLIVGGSAYSQDIQSSDFLSDYSQLKQSSDKYMNYTYLADAFRTSLAQSLSADYMIVDRPRPTKKIDLKGLTIEMEVLDSSGQEQLAALLETRPGTKDEPASWAVQEADIAVYSQRVRCRLDNARVAEENRVDCVSNMYGAIDYRA